MSDYYKRWGEQDCVATFASKKPEDFFASEIKHLKNIIMELHSVLDVGCASGRFIELLHSQGADPKYVGIDICASNIENAKRLYPNFSFHHTNALDFKPNETFDLVNATGVCQHEPEFEKLIQSMVTLSNKYVLFDVKLSKTDQHIVDLDKSFAGIEKNKLYFIILNLDKLIQFLSKLSRISEISIFGYETPLNNRTHVPLSITSVVSAGVLLTLQKDSIKPIIIESNVPEDLL